MEGKGKQRLVTDGWAGHTQITQKVNKSRPQGTSYLIDFTFTKNFTLLSQKCSYMIGFFSLLLFFFSSSSGKWEEPLTELKIEKLDNQTLLTIWYLSKACDCQWSLKLIKVTLCCHGNGSPFCLDGGVGTTGE